MILVVFSHKPVWISDSSPSGYATDGGFPMQMKYLSQIFNSTYLLLPKYPSNPVGEIPLSGNNLQIITLSKPFGNGIYRKLLFPFWFLFNLPKIIKYTLKADVIHSPVPGDVGTIGIFLAVIFRKKLFIRYCGNWFKIKTTAERFWKNCMENLKGKKYLMLATGGDSKPPSLKNPQIKWIFSTSISADEIEKDFKPKTLNSDNINLIIVSRQELEKGTGIVLQAVKILIDEGFKINLKVVGDGSHLNNFKQLSDSLSLNNFVSFLGKLSNIEVKNQLKSSNIFCFPTWSSEGFPKVVGEALAYGLPVIATPVSVIPELLSKGGGLLIEKPEPILLAGSIKKLILDNELYEKTSEIAFNTSKQFTLENWRDYIKEIMNNKWSINSKK